MALVVGGGLWFLHAYGRKVTTAPVESTRAPAWMKQGISLSARRPGDGPGGRCPRLIADAEILRQLAALQQQLQEQQAPLDALKRKPSTVINQHPAQAAKATRNRVQRPPGTMLYISHDLKEPPPGPKATEYTLAPGATKLPCQIETAMNSDVEGYFICKVTTNVYDTATGRHLLVPQGSSILGNNQSSQLLYGSERMDTISLTLTLPDGRSVDLGRAPVTDQQGVAGLTGDVNQHWWRLFGAVFIGGALKGGMNAMNVAVTSAAGAGTGRVRHRVCGQSGDEPRHYPRPEYSSDHHGRGRATLSMCCLPNHSHCPPCGRDLTDHHHGTDLGACTEVTMATQRHPHMHITVHHVIHQRPRLNGFLALFLLCGTALGVLFFGTSPW